MRWHQNAGIGVLDTRYLQIINGLSELELTDKSIPFIASDGSIAENNDYLKWDDSIKQLYVKAADSVSVAIKAVGFLQLQNTEADATNTTGIMQVAHYTKEQEALCAFFGTSTSTTGIIAFGGGSSAVNAATELRLFAAANNTTLRGTMIATLQTAGLGVGLTEGDVPLARLHSKDVVGAKLAMFEARGINTTDTVKRWFSGYDKTTTNATVTTLGAIAIDANKTYLLDIKVIARRTGGTAGTADDGAVYIRRAMVTTKAGVVTINAIQDGLTQEDQAGWDCTLAVLTTNILIRITGALDNNISWHANVEVCEISS